MAIEIEENNLKEPFMKLFENNEDYFFQHNELGDIGNIFRRVHKWYKQNIQLTDNIFIYKDWIYIKLKKEYLVEVQNILFKLPVDIPVKIEVF